MNSRLDETTFYDLDSVFSHVFFLEYSLATIGIFLNIPHLIISIQKPMRTCSTNSLIISIALCDFIALSCIVSDRSLEWINRKKSCESSHGYYHELVLLIIKITNQACNWTSFGLGVLLALIRLLVLKACSKSDFLTKSWLGYLFFIILIIFNALVSLQGYSGVRIKEGVRILYPSCSKSLEDYKKSVHFWFLGADKEAFRFMEYYKIYVAVTQITISIIYPILAILLFIEIRKSAERIADSNRSGCLERYRTSRMVLVLTFSYVITCTPTGIVWLIQSVVVIVHKSFLELLIGYGSVFASVLFCINAMSQGIICFSLSSKYRSTARALLRRKVKEIPAHDMRAINIH